MAVWAYSTTRLGLGGTPVPAHYFEKNRFLKLLVKSTAASVTGIKGVVFSAPAGSDLVGDKIGEFSGEAFEAALESSQAVLLVETRKFGGDYLDTSKTPKAIVQTSTGTILTTGLISGTIIED